MLKKLRQLLLKSSRIRQAVADYQDRQKEQRRKEHLLNMIFGGGMMRL